MSFLTIRRKYLRLLVVLFLLSLVIFSSLTSLKIVDYQIALDLDEENYFGKLYKSYFTNNENHHTTDTDSVFNRNVDKILQKKVKSDVEDKFWIVNYDFRQHSTLNIPSYYYDQSEEMPDVQPFDPRFTVAMYISHLKRQLLKKPHSQVEVPFHWGDWVDLSQLNKYLLAPDSEKPDCSILDARDDEDRLNKEKEQKEQKEKQELEDYERMKQEKLDEEKQKQQQKAEAKAESENSETGDKSEKESKDSEPQNNNENTQSAESENKEGRESESHTLAKRHSASDPKDFCIPNSQIPFNHKDGNRIRPGFNVFKPPGRVTEELGIIVGKSYLYSYAPAPASIIFLTKDGSYNVTCKSKKGLLTSNLVGDYLADSGRKNVDLYDEFTSLQAAHPPNKQRVINDYEVSLKPEDFNVNFDKIIEEYEDKIRTGQKLSDSELLYYRSLQYSKDRVENGGPPKYFGESRLIGTAIGDHYDWRFFNGIQYGTYEQTLTLHHLIRAFLSFCRKNGINTWVAHGSLLSWYWNGIAFPWDNDIDVQMSINDLHKLSRDFNQTLVVEDLEDGLGRYFLDSGSFITLRSRNNGNNNIDARFIDLDSGLYIDITGLALSNTSPPNRYKNKLPQDWKLDEKDYTKTNEILQVYNCRNNHFSNLNEITPLTRSNIEGEIGYIPKRFTEVLNVEYSKGMLSKKYSNHVYLQQLRLWVKEEDLYYFLNDKEKWANYHNFQEHYVKNKGNSKGIDSSPYELTEDEKKQLKYEAKIREKNGEKVHELSYNTKLKEEDLDLILNFKKEELLELVNKDEILMEYVATRDFTGFHEQEILDLLGDRSTRDLVEATGAFKPIKIDPFYFKVLSDYIDYDTQVETYVNLNKIYKASEPEPDTSE